jgi:hypothetical protein
VLIVPGDWSLRVLIPPVVTVVHVAIVMPLDTMRWA